MCTCVAVETLCVCKGRGGGNFGIKLLNDWILVSVCVCVCVVCTDLATLSVEV